jgi:hypothetical protein
MREIKYNYVWANKGQLGIFCMMNRKDKGMMSNMT